MTIMSRWPGLCWGSLRASQLPGFFACQLGEKGKCIAAFARTSNDLVQSAYKTFKICVLFVGKYSLKLFLCIRGLKEELDHSLLYQT